MECLILPNLVKVRVRSAQLLLRLFPLKLLLNLRNAL
jgi:hypothetical protein